MAKSRGFSIFLLKESFNSGNSLKEDHSLGKAVQDASNLPNEAKLYILDKPPSSPWWKDYWGIQQDLKQVLKGAIVFLPVDKRCFAITFGHTYHNLKEESFEYDFGLRTTLNAVDPDQLKSTDIFQPATSKRERIQSPVASELTFFDFNKDETIVKKLTGIVKNEYKDILTNITGSSSLKISSKVEAKEISNLCRRLLSIYNKEDFKQSFPDLQSIVPVKDPSLLEGLNKKLINAFNQKSTDLFLAIPEIIDYSDSYQISYSGSVDQYYSDVHIDQYKKCLGTQKVTLEMLKCHRLNITDENGTTKKSFYIFNCILFDCEENEKHYHLCDGEWYQIETNFMKKLKETLDPIFIDHKILKDCCYKQENEYNSKTSESDNTVCLDTTNIAPSGNVEPCDIYHVKDDIAELIHIKISTRSTHLSHLFNQGLNSIILLKSDNKSKDNLKKLLKNTSLYTPIDKDKFSVVYGIITPKPKEKKSDNLPIFSRISLKRTVDALRLMSVPISVVLINDTIDRKERNNDQL